ncbi:WUSCHEL-related homeobox 8-like [Musa acuminata AAA Group]|uniref:WUSCHEL-related homeobox 8-like n=1 Tax=Musa acuminata AAA Group TaxID=214697 RepID=UPI0031E01C49
MASSNRHWPSMFKSKPCNAHHHQWQHDINSCHQKTPYASGFEERSPEPKPRWNPKPEQIRILEAIFNSGMVNPPRDEIRRIRAQLQEYGQVGDANVFYWFQNRKSRSKNKQRHLQATRSQTQPSSAAPSPPPVATKPTSTATSSSSSSSEQSTGSDKTQLPVASMGGALTSMVHSATPLPVTSVNPMYLHGSLELGGEPFLLQGPQGYCFPAAELTGIIGVPEHGTGVHPGPWGDLMGFKSGEDDAKVTVQLHHLYGTGSSSAPSVATTVTSANASGGGGGGAGATAGVAATAAIFGSSIDEIQVLHQHVIPSSSNHNYASIYIIRPFNTFLPPMSSSSSATVMGVGGSGGAAAARSTVFINEVAFEVAAGPVNVREAFGHEAILIDHSGRPVLTDEWGVTIHPLRHGASYYLV